jgi:hypothetical protein
MKAPWHALPVLFLLTGPLSAQSVGRLVLPSTMLEESRTQIPPPLRLAVESAVAPMAELPSAVFGAREELRQLQEWNDKGRVPTRGGIVRDLSARQRQRVELGTEMPLEGEVREHAGGVMAARSGGLVWGTRVRVEEAFRLRLHLSDVALPQGARMWVYGTGGEVVGPFGLELKDAKGGLWTPSVEGPEIHLEVELPAGSLARFQVDQTGEILAPWLLTAQWEDTTCYIDGRCVGRDRLGSIDLYRKAVAHLQFASGRFLGFCTGALVNDTDTRTAIPYLLTANHCISEGPEASSLEAFFDYARTSCNGALPTLSRMPRSSGSSIMATGDGSDFTLLRLSRVPPGRVLLGWNASPEALATGVRLNRLSHPRYDQPGALAFPQTYSETTIDANSPTHQSLPRSRFIYSRPSAGGTFSGGSGAPVVLSNGQVVGQLYGAVGNDLSSGCVQSLLVVDGSFATSYPSVRPFLDPPAPCRPGPDHLCLGGNRFRVRVSWQNQFDGSAGSGRPIPRSDVSGFFSFGDPSNVELLVKILDFGSEVKVFWGQLTNLRYQLEVTDTRTGRTETYRNTTGECGGIDQDFSKSTSTSTASSTVAATAPRSVTAAAGTCKTGPNTLCLLDRRFAVELDWRNPFNNTSGVGGAGTLSNITGTFTFGDRSNVELMVKMLNLEDRTAIFWGALSDLEYTLRVTDTTTGVVKTYSNPAGRLCGGIDNNAF